jgi:predicted ribosome quality control (RQC) complex YloA/Tae2 family protein
LAFDEVPRSTVEDAAVLAARYSKAGATRAKVTVVRCRDISKPTGFVPGMVLLSPGAETRVLRVDLKKDAARLDRLEAQQQREEAPGA